MADTHAQFEERIRLLTQKHGGRARGHVAYVDAQGLIIARPRRRRHVPVKGPVIFVAVFLVFKGFLLASLGADAYAARVEALAGGTGVERVGAAIMRPDPAALWISRELRPYLR